MADEINKRDGNRITTLSGVTDDASLEVRQLRVDPTTKRLKVSAIIAGGGAPVPETPSGIINGVNAVFTISAAPVEQMLFLNGAFQTETTDYTLSGTTITYVEAPASASTHTIFIWS